MRIDEGRDIDWYDAVAHVASMGSEDFVAAWGVDREVWVNVRAGASWEGAERLSRVAREGPVIAGAAGRAMVAWTAFDGEFYRVYSSHREPGSWWSIPEVVPAPPGDAREPHLALGRDSAAVVFQQTGEEGDLVWASVWSEGTGWEPAVSPQAVDGLPLATEVAMNDSGKVTIAWSQWTERSVGQIWAVHHDPGQGWSPAVRVDDEWRASLSLAVKVQEGGTSLLLWWGELDPGPHDQLVGRHTEGSDWSGVTPIGPEGDHDGHLRISSQGGWAAIGWPQRIRSTETDRDESVLTVAVRDPRGHWVSEAVGPEESAASLAVAVVGCDGSAVVAWPLGRWNGEVLVQGVFARTRQRDGPWSAETRLDLGEAGGNPFDIASSRDGAAVVVWLQTDRLANGSVVSGLWSSALE